MKNENTGIKAEIIAMQKYGREAAELISKINSSVEEVEKSKEEQLEILKKKIIEDLEELYSYADAHIYQTKSLNLYNYMPRIESRDGNSYPIANLEINFDKKNYVIDDDHGKAAYKIAVIENCHTYRPIYADGKFSTEYCMQKALKAMFENWPELLAGAYAEMKKAYQQDTSKKLDEAVNAQVKAEKDFKAIKAVNDSFN